MTDLRSRTGEQRFLSLQRLLHSESRSAQALAEALGISQPTLSRTIQQFPDALTSFRVAGHRTPQYALLRDLPHGLLPRQEVYRVTSTGAIEPFAAVEFLSGGSMLERRAAGAAVYGGLPPYMAFAAPSGFLGRHVAAEVASEMQLPANLKDWGDDHRIAYLFDASFNLAGNLVYGSRTLDREMALRQAAVTTVADKAAHYVALASRMKQASHGSSAGGEQPKFLAFVEDTGHVIVKFARQGSRMADLLPLEQLALRSLEAVGVPAARTQLLASGGYVFLEVQRFDRVGAHGRLGLLSAGAIDDESFGARDSWSEFASRCEQAKLLSREDARRVDVMAAFSELIGNGDRHFENISVLIGDDGKYSGLAPAYDILPMRYASLGGGLDPDLLPITPKVGTIGARPDVWARAADAAQRFWKDAARAGPPAFRALAKANLAIASAFVAPLLPAG